MAKEKRSAAASIDSSKDSNFGAYFNVICVVAGTGILGLPYATAQTGWLSIIIYVLVAVVAVYTGNLAIECLYINKVNPENYETEEERLTSFPEIGYRAFGRFGRMFIHIFHNLILLASGCIYILLAGLNLFSLIDGRAEQLSLKLCILIVGCVVAIPTITLKTLKEVSLLSIFGTVATLITIFCVVIGGYFDANNLSLSNNNETELLNYRNIPLTLTTVAFSYGGNVVYPHIELSLRNRRDWFKLLTLAIITITVMYLVMAIVGYHYFGESVKSPILNSLSQGAPSIIAYIAITLHVILACPLYLNAFCLEQELKLKIDRTNMSRTKEFACRFVLRLIVVGIITLIAIYLPYFQDLMSLTGAVSNCIMVFLVPVICHYKIFGWRNRKVWDYALACITVIISLVGLIIGTYDAITSLIASIEKDRQKL